jgi:hypothetical protein
LKTSTLIKLGANFVVEVEREGPDDERPRLTFYRMEMTETPAAAEVRALVAALSAMSTGEDRESSRDVENAENTGRDRHRDRHR